LDIEVDNGMVHFLQEQAEWESAAANHTAIAALCHDLSTKETSIVIDLG
jgi:hypothetical protein